MEEVLIQNDVVAIIHKKDEWKEGLDFLTADETYIQAGTWWYHKGKNLNAHRHKIYNRTVKQTQETVIVMNGVLRIDFYNIDNTIVCSKTLTRGDICIILNVGHGYEILEDNTKIIEIKNGPFISVEKDKEMI